MSLTISQMAREAYETSKSKGWHDCPCRAKCTGNCAGAPTFGDRIALCHSELSEALEAYRERPDDGYTWGPFDPIYRNPTTGKFTREPSHYEGHSVGFDANGAMIELADIQVLHKPEGVPSELADVLIRIGDMAYLYGIDLEKAVEEKMAYNKTRSFRHGGKRL